MASHIASGEATTAPARMDEKKTVAPSTPDDSISVQDGTTTEPGMVLTHDEYHLATLGYKQEFIRCLGFFESWAATCMFPPCEPDIQHWNHI